MCEPGIVRAMMSMGVPYEEAVTCDIKGCYEYSVRAREVSLGQTYLNLAKFVLLALRNGRDERTGEQIGPQDGRSGNVYRIWRPVESIFCARRSISSGAPSR